MSQETVTKRPEENVVYGPLDRSNTFGWIEVAPGVWHPGPDAHKQMEVFRASNRERIRSELLQALKEIVKSLSE